MYCTLPQKNKVSYFLTIKRCILQASLQIFASCPILRVSRLDPYLRYFLATDVVKESSSLYKRQE